MENKFIFFNYLNDDDGLKPFEFISSNSPKGFHRICNRMIMPVLKQASYETSVDGINFIFSMLSFSRHF